MGIKRLFYSQSIFGRIQFWFMAITVFLLLIGGVITHRVLTSVFLDNLESTINSTLKFRSEVIEAQFNQLYEETYLLSNNSFVANGLVDSLGRDLYLLPFLNQHPFSLKEKVDVFLVDYQGQLVTTAWEGSAAFSEPEVSAISRSLSSEKPIVSILSRNSRYQLVIIQPVIFPPTQSAEGAVLARFDLTSFMEDSLVTDTYSEEFRLFRNETELFSSLSNASLMGEVFVTKRRPIEMQGLDGLLMLEFRQDDATINSILNKINFWLVFFCSIMLVAMYFLARLVVKPITSPLAELSEAAQKIIKGDWEAPNIKRGGNTTEIRTLSSSFIKMVEVVRSANQDLKDRIEDRNAQLARSSVKLAQTSSAFEHSAEGIFIVDSDGAILSVNPSFKKMSGRTSNELIEHSWLQLSGVISVKDKDLPSIWSDLIAHRIWQGEVDILSNNTKLTVMVTANIVQLDDNHVESYVFIFTDITHRKNAEKRIDFIAHHDALTGLPNRLLMMDRLDQLIKQSQRLDLGFSVIFMDLDRFKNINDSLGHSTGDELLIEVSKRLKTPLRQGDTLVRLGGDEFVLLCPQLNRLEDSASVPTKILSQFVAPINVNDHLLYASTSIGIAIYPSDGTDIETLLKNADRAMYEAKNDGGNAYRFFDGEMNQKIKRRQYIENQLRSALDKGQFELYFQPKFNMHPRVLYGFEALIRWKVDGQFIGPNEFIPIAEEIGLIVAIGDWVAIQAIKTCKMFNGLGCGELKMAINVSVKQLFEKEFSQTIIGYMEDECLPPECLEVELTESILAINTPALVVNINKLNDTGVCISIDDFGTGFSNLSYLKSFPLGRLKIDQCFIADILSDPSNAEISKSIIHLAHGMGMKVIAEGIESEEIFDFLKENGCDEAQGYLLGRPVNSEQTVSLLQHLRGTEYQPNGEPSPEHPNTA
jgi:diguanylate cyclase (GGDEF)-like protein/PAS domain S-box-containing protein